MNQSRTAVLTCNCVHLYQDEKYGKNKRLHNETEKGYRCTVCGNEKNK
jgi:hypothetical protein